MTKQVDISTNIKTYFNKFQHTFQPISTLLKLRGGARAGSAGLRARHSSVDLATRIQATGPAPRRQVLEVAPEERNVWHPVETQNVATEWAHSPSPYNCTDRSTGRSFGKMIQVRATLAFARGFAIAARWREEAAGQLCLHECIPGMQQPAGVTRLGLNHTAGVIGTHCLRMQRNSFLLYLLLQSSKIKVYFR
jgi:hypothetical protein